MSKSNEIAELLLAAGCDPASEEKLVDKICLAIYDHDALQAGIAMAICLKFLARKLDHDNAAETNENADEQLAMIMELADCYNVNIHHND